MIRNWIDTLKEKTGRSLDAWTDLVRRKGPKTTDERKAWLKSDHGLGTNEAGWIVDYVEGKPDIETGDPEVYVRRAAEYIESMFSGSKAGLRPIFDRLYTLARGIGKDVKISPGKTIVSIYRNHVIAQVKPSTRTRIDFGFALKDTPAKGRLVDTGGLAKGDRITHRIEITSADQINDTVEKWLRKAYEMDD